VLVFFVVFFSGVLAFAAVFLPRVVFFAEVSSFSGLTIVTAFFVPLVFLAGVFAFTGEGDFSTALDFFVALVFLGVAFFTGDDFTGEGDFSAALDFLAVLVVFLVVDVAALTGVSAFLAGVALSAALVLVALPFLGGLAAGCSSTAASAFTGEAGRFTGVVLAGAAALPRVALAFLAGVASLAGASAAAALPRVALAFLGGEMASCSSLIGEGEALRFEVVFSGSDFPRREVRLTGSSAVGAISTWSDSLDASAGATFFPPRTFLVLMGFSGDALAAGAALPRVALPRVALTGLTGISVSLMGSSRLNFVFIGFSFNEDFAA